MNRQQLTAVFAACMLFVMAWGTTSGAAQYGYGAVGARAFTPNNPFMTYSTIDDEYMGSDTQFTLETDTRWWLPHSELQGGIALTITPPVSLGYAYMEIDPDTDTIKGRAGAIGFNMRGGQSDSFGYLKSVYQVTSNAHAPGETVQLEASMTLQGYFELQYSDSIGTPTFARELVLVSELDQDPSYFASDNYYLDTVPPLMECGMNYLGVLDQTQEPDENDMEPGGSGTHAYASNTGLISYYDEVETATYGMVLDVQVGDVIMMETILSLWATSPDEAEVWTNYGNSLDSSITPLTGGVELTAFDNGSNPPGEVPAPAAIWLLGTGLVAVAAGRARRK